MTSNRRATVAVNLELMKSGNGCSIFDVSKTHTFSAPLCQNFRDLKTGHRRSVTHLPSPISEARIANIAKRRQLRNILAYPPYADLVPI